MTETAPKPMPPAVNMALEIEKVFDPNGDSPIGTDHFNAICDVCEKWLCRPQQSAEPVASSMCPVCGVDTPHGHSPQDIENWLHVQASRFGHDFDLVRFEPSTVELSEFVKHWREQPYWGWSGTLLHRSLDELDALIKRSAASPGPSELVEEMEAIVNEFEYIEFSSWQPYREYAKEDDVQEFVDKLRALITRHRGKS